MSHRPGTILMHPVASSRSARLQNPEIKYVVHLTVRGDPAAAEVTSLLQRLGSFTEDRNSICSIYTVAVSAWVLVPHAAAPSSGQCRYCTPQVSMQTHGYTQNHPPASRVVNYNE